MSVEHEADTLQVTRTSKSKPSDFLVRSTTFVWGTWVFLVVVALAYVGRFGSNVPSWDDWDLVPTMTGAQPISIEWLWSQHNEHRVPVSRLLNLALFRVFGLDFRVGMYFNVLAMGAVAFLLVDTARRLRGRLIHADAFFPLLFLNLGQGLNFIWGWQVEFFLSTLIVSIVLVIVARSGPRPSLGASAATGLCLVLLCGCGAHGLAVVPSLSLWLLDSAARRWRSREGAWRRDLLLLLGLGALALTSLVLYLVGYEPVPYHPKSSGPAATLETCSKYLSMGFGPAIRAIWPFSGILVLNLLMSSAVVLAAILWIDPRERHRAVGLLLFLGAMATLGLAVGLGRDGFEPRYISLSVPALACSYLVFVIYGNRFILTADYARNDHDHDHPAGAGRVTSRRMKIARPGDVFTMLFFLASLATLVPNTLSGIHYARYLRWNLRGFESDMKAGLTCSQLIAKHYKNLHIHHAILEDYMPMLRRAKVGNFRFLREDPPFRISSLPLQPLGMYQVVWDEKTRTARTTGDPGYLDFALPEAWRVAGIRVRFAHRNRNQTPPKLVIAWKRPDQEDFVMGQDYVDSPTGDHANWSRGTWTRLAQPTTTLTVWVHDRIDRIRIYPDQVPCEFRIDELEVLEPSDE